MDPIDCVKVEIRVLEQQNALMMNNAPRISRSAFKTLESLEAFTENCMRLAELHTELKRLISLEALRAKQERDHKIERDYNIAFSKLCDAIEPKWPVGSMFFI